LVRFWAGRAVGSRVGGAPLLGWAGSGFGGAVGEGGVSCGAVLGVGVIRHLLWWVLWGSRLESAWLLGGRKLLCTGRWGCCGLRRLWGCAVGLAVSRLWGLGGRGGGGGCCGGCVVGGGVRRVACWGERLASGVTGGGLAGGDWWGVVGGGSRRGAWAGFSARGGWALLASFGWGVLVFGRGARSWVRLIVRGALVSGPGCSDGRGVRGEGPGLAGTGASGGRGRFLSRGLLDRGRRRRCSGPCVKRHRLFEGPRRLGGRNPV